MKIKQLLNSDDLKYLNAHSDSFGHPYPMYIDDCINEHLTELEISEYALWRISTKLDILCEIIERQEIPFS